MRRLLARLPRPRTLRGRIGAITALAVFLAVLVTGTAAFVAAAHGLGEQFENRLRGDLQLVTIEALAGDGALCDPAREDLARASDADLTVEIREPSGRTCGTPAVGALGPVERLGHGRFPGMFGSDLLEGETPGGTPVLALRDTMPDGTVVTVARPIGAIETIVGRYRGMLLVFGLVGALIALGVGRAVARAGLRPVNRLADAAEHIADTQDLSVRVEAPRGRRPDDEITRLAGAFDRMTDSLAAARRRQAQLVADAGHELRTPLTSLRTNVDLLVRSDRAGRPLPPGQREALLGDLSAQVDELSELVSQLVVLAGDEPGRPWGPADLGTIVEAAVARVRRRAAGHTLTVSTRPWRLDPADAEALERAIVNVLDNAVKFSPPGSTVEVRLERGVLTVDDAGPGVPPEARQDAFARFWRADAARALPGSGLGLAIVADAVAAHGGSAEILDSPQGGARLRLAFGGTGHAAP